jgi:hypothetical protein
MWRGSAWPRCPKWPYSSYPPLDDARTVVDRLMLVERPERAPAGTTVVVLADDGWSLLDDPAARSAARDVFLGR